MARIPAGLPASENKSASIFNLALAHFPQSRLLVLGDTIVDQYTACDALGMSAEAPVLVVRELKTREYLGGACIVAAHASSLGAKCYFLSVVGKMKMHKFVKQQLDRYQVTHSLIIGFQPSNDFQDTLHGGEPETLPCQPPTGTQSLLRSGSQIIERLRELAPQLDGILVSDFVYGVITENILTVLQELKKNTG